MIQTWIDKLRQTLGARRYAYRATFKGPHAEIVLMDLARFCRAHQSTFLPDARAHAVLEGRREVFLRIQNHLKLTDEQLWELYSGASSSTKGE